MQLLLRDKDGEGKDTKVVNRTDNKNADTPAAKDELNEVVYVLQPDNKVKMVKVKTDMSRT
jgi:hypothetical protein